MTRNESSDLLGVSTQTLMNYERRGDLHPQHVMRPDSNGVSRRTIVYDPKELAKLPRYKRPVATREPGEVAAQSFELFRQGLALDEVVIALRETPDKVDQLNERWLDQTKARYVITPEAQKALEQLVGAFTSVTELVELITKKLASA
jgi:hypothetical protein